MTVEEYHKRFMESQRVEGYGPEMKIHVPCPFCAAPDIMIHTLMETHEAYANGGKCQECGRSFRAVYSGGEPGKIAFEIVQTGGDDPPDFLPPMRRVYES